MSSNEKEFLTSLPPLEAIAEEAKQSAITLRQRCLEFQDIYQKAWRDYSQALIPSGEVWYGSDQARDQFLNTLREANHIFPPNLTSDTIQLLTKRGAIRDDWNSLAGFLTHDYEHLKPGWLVRAFFDNLRYVNQHQWGSGAILSRHKHLLDEIADHSGSLASLMAYPLDMTAAAVQLESQKEIPASPCYPLELFHKMALQIWGRFAQEDYHIRVNDPSTLPYPANTIDIVCPPELSLSLNESMLFAITYNLVKNAAKANGEQHFQEKDLALDKLYEKGEPVKTSRSLSIIANETDLNVTFTVSDQGSGMSLDKTMHRLHQELAARLAQHGSSSIRQTEWYWNLRRALGQHQTDLILAWPENPLAMRGLTVGTIFDCQFVAGFSGQAWDVRSLTSGMGLWGVRYLTEKLGGTVMGTNSFQGGAQFSFMIPKTQSLH